MPPSTPQPRAHPSTSSPPSPAPSPSAPHVHTYESFADIVASSPDRRRSTSSRFASSPLASTPIKALQWKRYGSSDALGPSAGYGELQRADRVEERQSKGKGTGEPAQGDDEGRRDWLSTWGLISLTIGLAGAQLTWTVEMAFGTPYLLSLGLTKQSTSLVWLAGPLSGLLVQPIIGALSDSSSSRYRRRSFIVGSAFFVILSTLVVAYARGLATLLHSLSGLGDWDPDREQGIKSLTIIIAVVAFYVLDFSLNGLQATLRALILDQSPSGQQNIANAYHGRMTHLANIFGYLAGYVNLGEWSGMSWIGGGQFRKLAVLSCAVMVICVTITCYSQQEREIVEKVGSRKGIKWRKALKNVKESIRHLPLPVQRVCAVQFFAWSAYFPFLFYSTTYVAEIVYASVPRGQPLPSADTATRAGSLALLYFALVAFAAGSVLPWLSTLGRRRLVSSMSPSLRSRFIIRSLMVMTPRNFWTAGLTLYGVLMTGTFFVHSLDGAMLIIAALGIPWAINCWVPFALVMESIRDGESAPSTSPTPATPSLHSLSASATYAQPFRAQLLQGSVGRFQADVHQQQQHHTEASPLLTGDTSADLEDALRSSTEREQSGGTILGIHNLAIVAPQFFVAIVAALIFKVLGKVVNDTDGSDDGLRGSNDVVWVLRFGAVMSLIGAVVSRRVLETKSEREYVTLLEAQLKATQGEDQEETVR